MANTARRTTVNAVYIGNKAPQSDIDKVMYDGGVGKNFDARLWLSSTNGNVTTFTQNLSNIKKPDSNLTDFIQNQAPSYKYSWDRGVVVAYQQPITVTQPISPAKKISGSQSQISDRQLRSKDSAVINGGGGVDLRGTNSIEASSNTLVKTTLDYPIKMGEKIQEGANFETEAGGTVGAFIAGRTTVGQVFDLHTREICTTKTNCVIVGPYGSAQAHIGGSISTGSVSQGSVTQIGVTGTLATIKGVDLSATLNSDGSYTVGTEGAAGFSAGFGLMICQKETTDLCVKKEK